jgi:hypothetical protein
VDLGVREYTATELGLRQGESGMKTQRRLVQTRTQRLRRVLLLACPLRETLDIIGQVLEDREYPKNTGRQ